MLMTLAQMDVHYAAAAIVCAVLLFVFLITTKRLDAALRKPLVALILAVVVGVVIYGSKAIPMVVIGMLCLGFLVCIVRNLIQDRDAKQQKMTPSQPVAQQPVKDSGIATTEASLVHTTPLINITEWVNSLLPILSIVAVMSFFGLMSLMLNKNQFMSLVGLMHSTPSSVSTVHSVPTMLVNTALANTATPKVDAQRDTAFRSYQQALIDHETSVHSVDEAWADLSKRAVKRDRRTWLKSQQAWATSKSHVCGSIDAVQHVDADTAAALDLKTKTLRCDTDANRNRASYIRSSVEAIITGHQPSDEIGHLIQNLNNQ